MQVDFYHLTRRPLEQVLPRLAERVVEGGGRLLVVAAEASAREAIDRLLWTYAADSFLPHARAGNDDDAAQPVLIAPDLTAANGARHVLLADGTWRDGATAFDRAFHLFDAEHTPAARIAWKSLADRAGVERRYWKQNEAGRWENAA